MHDDVRAKLYRAGQNRRGCGAVHNEDATCRVGSVCSLGDVCGFEPWIGRRLNENKIDLGADGLSERCTVARVDLDHLDTAPFGKTTQPFRCAPINTRLHNGPRAGWKPTEGRGDGGHAGGEQKRLGGSFEFGNDGLGRAHRFIVGPQIDVIGIERRIGLVATVGR